MEKIIKSKIAFLFYVLFFSTPLVVFPQTSELFEFNKIVAVYIITTLILTLWIAKMIINKKIILRRTIIDVPLLVFILSIAISTSSSIDRYTSIFGYYSRFNGGLLSLICYSLLYWAYVSNMDKVKTRKSIYILFTSAFLVSIYAILQHFGIDKDIWVQDVQNRVFATLGQPNWLAAWIVALLPLTWVKALNLKLKTQNLKLQSKGRMYIVLLTLSLIFFLTLLYTKSRSGILGFLAAALVFWAPLILLTSFAKTRFKPVLREFFIFNSLFLILALAVGTPWTPNLKQILKRSLISNSNDELPVISAPALEIGGTESGEIRKIVWKGAIGVFKKYPVSGSGPETFAYSYYQSRPPEHNLVSEWDYLYNKAHNEYLNYLATTGMLGLIFYLSLIFFSLIQILKLKNTNLELKIATKNSKLSNYINRDLNNSFEAQILRFALLAGFVSILVTNFFGFSVVSTSLLFFLYPAFASTIELDFEKMEKDKPTSLSILQKLETVSLCSLSLLLLYLISRYWYADLLYAKAKTFNNSERYQEARNLLLRSIEISPLQAVYYDELSKSSSQLAIINYEKGAIQNSEYFAGASISELDTALELSPRNINFWRNKAALFLKFSALNEELMLAAAKSLEQAIIFSPTDAKLYYNLSLTYARLKDDEKAIAVMEEAVKLKKNYRDARYALAILYTKQNRVEEAKKELNYILININPNDTLVREQLEQLP